MKVLLYALVINLSLILTCNQADNVIDDGPNTQNHIETIRILSLGDSYTIGESVCSTCKFPEQLKNGLKSYFNSKPTMDLKVVAKTGWTTTNLISALEAEDIPSSYDLTTLLIGVNNQYQGIPFRIYKREFAELVEKATTYAQDDTSNLIVVSIPDYAYTPFGGGDKNISDDIDKYNDFAQEYCEQKKITYVNITDITRNGFDDPNLVASDGLHPSKLAYSKFIERILPHAIEKLQ